MPIGHRGGFFKADVSNASSSSERKDEGLTLETSALETHQHS